MRLRQLMRQGRLSAVLENEARETGASEAEGEAEAGVEPSGADTDSPPGVQEGRGEPGPRVRLVRQPTTKDTMGIFDKIKGLAKKNEKHVDQGIDKTEAVAHDKIGDKVGTDKIDTAAEKAHDAADKLTEG